MALEHSFGAKRIYSHRVAIGQSIGDILNRRRGPKMDVQLLTFGRLDHQVRPHAGPARGGLARAGFDSSDCARE
jgi:hypothetical protein